MPISKNIKYCRTRRNMTQQAFADAIGVSKTTVGSWENKKSSVPLKSVQIVAEFFGVDFIDFCDIDLEALDQLVDGQELRLTKQEIQNIIIFRQLPDHIKSLIRHTIHSEYERINTSDTKSTGDTNDQL